MFLASPRRANLCRAFDHPRFPSERVRTLFAPTEWGEVFAFGNPPPEIRNFRINTNSVVNSNFCCVIHLSNIYIFNFSIYFQFNFINTLLYILRNILVLKIKAKMYVASLFVFHLIFFLVYVSFLVRTRRAPPHASNLI